MKIEIISATRKSEAEFKSHSPLGLSLVRLSYDKDITAKIALDNRRGLPQVYNAGFTRADLDSIVVFMHDDVWIDDYYLKQRLLDGLEHFDIIGVAGNRRRVQNQPAWAFVDLNFIWDTPENLSGSVGHGERPFGRVTRFGEAPAACELLDGVFMAAKKSTLLRSHLSFDERFTFDFYDLDFCRTARGRGLKLGTWPICITHQSTGGFGSDTWRAGQIAYTQKWGD